MVWNNRYIDINKNGKVVTAKNTPTENSIDTIDMVEPEMPTDAIYALYYNEIEGLHYIKVADFEPTKPNQDELQWQAITDLEINQMEYNQALTDLEIKYLEGGINI
jgi:hypothetical protein